MTDVITTRLTTPDGVKRAFCDSLCLVQWRLAAFTTVVDAVESDDPRRVMGSHVSCSWCGTLVAKPADSCRWCEPGDCPEFDPMASWHVQYAVRLLREQVGGPLSPRAFAYLTDHARALNDAHRLDARDLVKHLQDTRIDWDSNW